MTYRSLNIKMTAILKQFKRLYPLTYVQRFWPESCVQSVVKIEQSFWLQRGSTHTNTNIS